MFTETLLPLTGSLEAPNSFHLLAHIFLPHRLIIEAVLALFVLRRPQDRLRRVGEVATRQIRRRIRLFPRDVVQDFEPELLHRIADGKNDMLRARDPDRAIGLEHALASAQPFGVELMVQLRPARFVPFALVHFHHLAGVTGDASIGQEVRRVGKNHVEQPRGMTRGDAVEKLQAIALIKPDAVPVIAVDALHRALAGRRKGNVLKRIAHRRHGG